MPEPVYFVTCDNPRAGDYRRPPRELGKVGHVERTVPKTGRKAHPRKSAR